MRPLVTRFSGRRLPRHGRRFFAASSLQDLWNPTPEHKALRESLRSFVKKEVRWFAAEFMHVFH